MSEESPVRVEVRGQVAAQPLPCPFCGSTLAHLAVQYGDKAEARLSCGTCGARGPQAATSVEARRLWDTRHFRVAAGWDPAAAERWAAEHSSGPDSSRS